MHRTIALIAVATVLLTMQVAAAHRTPRFEVRLGDPHVLAVADLVISDSPLPPTNAAWQRVTLPEDWRDESRYLLGQQGWYRFDLSRFSPPTEPWSVYLWRFSMNAEVFMNGEFIGSGGSFDEPIARNWNRPLLFSIPASLWREHGNELLVRLRVYPGFGNMMPIAVGPTAELRRDYDGRFFRQITLGEASTLFTLCITAVALAFWLVNREETAYLYFGLSSLAWSIYTLNLHLRVIPVSAPVWWSLMHAALDVFGGFLVLFAHRLFAVHRPWVDRGVIAFMVTSLLCYSTWDLPQIARYSNLTHSVATLFGLYLAAWSIGRAVRRPSTDVVVFAISMAAVIALAIHDLLLATLAVPGLWRTQSYMVQFAAPLLFLVMIVHLTGRFRHALQRDRRHNVELRERVAEATRSLEESFRARQALERQQAAAIERERIYRDLHDDVGAKVLSLIYGASTEHEAALARGVMNELRSIVSTGHFEGGQLREISVQMRAESQRRCDEAGFRLDWREVGDARLTASQHYQLQRILRELVSNVIQHSGGDTVNVTLTADERELSLTVCDNGTGMARASRENGHGLTGIRQRVADLTGRVQWTSGNPHGTCCSITIPLPPNQGV